MIEESLLIFLACPVTGSAMKFDAERELLVSEDGTVGFPVFNGIPILAAEEAINLIPGDNKETSRP